MANTEHIQILEQGVNVWNKWRKNNPEIVPDLSGERFSGENLDGYDLSNADLTNTNWYNCHLSTDLRSARLNGAHIGYTDITNANLNGADLSDLTFENIRLDSFIRAEYTTNLPEKLREDLIIAKLAYVINEINELSIIKDPGVKIKTIVKEIYERISPEAESKHIDRLERKKNSNIQHR